MCGAGGSGGYFQFETQTIWSKHYIAYAANQFDIYVDGYTHLRLRNSRGTALQIQANGLNVTMGGTLTQNSDERIKTDNAKFASQSVSAGLRCSRYPTVQAHRL